MGLGHQGGYNLVCFICCCLVDIFLFTYFVDNLLLSGRGFESGGLLCSYLNLFDEYLGGAK